MSSKHGSAKITLRDDDKAAVPASIAVIPAVVILETVPLDTPTRNVVLSPVRVFVAGPTMRANPDAVSLASLAGLLLEPVTRVSIATLATTCTRHCPAVAPLIRSGQYLLVPARAAPLFRPVVGSNPTTLSHLAVVCAPLWPPA